MICFARHTTRHVAKNLRTSFKTAKHKGTGSRKAEKEQGAKLASQSWGAGQKFCGGGVMEEPVAVRPLA